MSNANEFKITRTFDAPRELMFKVWTEAEHLKHWWGPVGMELTISKIDLQPNGMLLYKMKSPDGFEMWGKFIYKEIVEPEKLVFIVSFSDENGGYTRHPASNTWPIEVESTIILTEENGKTTLEMTGIPINATDEEVQEFVVGFSSMEQGWGGTLLQLENYLKIVTL